MNLVPLLPFLNVLLCGKAILLRVLNDFVVLHFAQARAMFIIDLFLTAFALILKITLEHAIHLLFPHNVDAVSSIKKQVTPRYVLMLHRLIATVIIIFFRLFVYYDLLR